MHHFQESFRRTAGPRSFLHTNTYRKSFSQFVQEKWTRWLKVLLLQRLNKHRVGFGFVHQTWRVLWAFQVSWNVKLRINEMMQFHVSADEEGFDAISMWTQICVTSNELLMKLLWFLMFRFKASHHIRRVCLHVCVCVSEGRLSPVLSRWSLWTHLITDSNISLIVAVVNKPVCARQPGDAVSLGCFFTSSGCSPALCGSVVADVSLRSSYEPLNDVLMLSSPWHLAAARQMYSNLVNLVYYSFHCPHITAEHFPEYTISF